MLRPHLIITVAYLIRFLKNALLLSLYRATFYIFIAILRNMLYTSMR